MLKYLNDLWGENMPNKDRYGKMRNALKRKKYSLEIMQKALVNYDKIQYYQEQKLKNLGYSKNFDSKLYLKGEEWYNSGLTLADAPEELINNKSFINGYKRGERIALAKELEQKIRVK